MIMSLQLKKSCKRGGVVVAKVISFDIFRKAKSSVIFSSQSSIPEKARPKSLTVITIKAEFCLFVEATPRAYSSLRERVSVAGRDTSRKLKRLDDLLRATPPPSEIFIILTPFDGSSLSSSKFKALASLMFERVTILLYGITSFGI